MIIGDNYIFVQVPRTSSSSISAVLMDNTNAEAPSIHASFLDMETDTTNKEIFAFVRNPYEREFSQWKYHTSKEYDVLQPMSFEQWVLWRYADMELPEDMFREGVKDYLRTFSRYPQLGWLFNKTGDLVVNNIGYFEHREFCTKQMLDKLDISIQSFPHIEKSLESIPTASYVDFYTPELRDIIEERYKADLQAFGYDFNKTATGAICLDHVTDFSFLEETECYLHK